MEAMIARRSSTVSLPISVGLSKRRTTDKYWIVLFVVAIIIWIFSGPQVVRVKLDGKIYNSDNSALANTTSECIRTKPDNATITKATSLYVSHVLGKHWLLDVITCNAGFLDANYSRSGLIVIWAHVLFCVCLLIYIFTSMRTDEIYRKQFFLSIITLVAVSILTQGLSIVKYLLDHSYMSHVFEFIFNAIFWLVPEAILGIIGHTIHMSYERDDSKRNVDDDNDNGNNNSSSINLWFFLGNPLSFILLLIQILFIITIMTLPQLFFEHVNTVFKYKLVWSSEWFANGIAILAACYVILIIYYFLLMATSCLTSISYEKRNDGEIKDIWRALSIVAKCHFGTVCYHATLIFPRIHATFVMNEKEFRRNPKVSAIYRLYLTYWKIPNLSPTVTGACGYSHSKSTRELLRLFNSDSPNSKKLQTFSQIHKCCSALLMVIFNLILILLWTHGVIINHGYTTTIWLAYLLSIYVTYIITRFYDAVADVLWYLDDGTVIIKF